VIPDRSWKLIYWCFALAGGLACNPALSGQQPQARRENLASAQRSTGPEVGQKIPFFQAPDQNGTLRDFNSIRGPKGAMIVFFRSADW